MGIQTGWNGGQAGRGAGLTVAPEVVLTQPFQPAYLNHSSELYQSLAGSYTMPFLGLDLASSASKALSNGIVDALPYLLMIAIVAVTGWYQQKQMQARSSGPANPQQQTISRVMLFFLPAISFGLPAGVVLYFVVSNLYRVGQQAYITRTLYKGDDPIPAVADAVENKGGPTSDKGGAAKANKGDAAKVDKDAKADKPASKSQNNGAKGGGRVFGAVAPKSKPKPSGAAKGSRKTFTSDPRRKPSTSTPQQAPARPRKKRK
jgi:hypothetical protein